MVDEPVNASSPAGDIASRRGAFLELPLPLVDAVVLDTFPEMRWLANVVGVRSSEKGEPSP